jgi:hypothetical protein
MQTSFRLTNPTFTPSQDSSVLRLATSPNIEARERRMDQVLADSFPASDPPPWTFGRIGTPISTPSDSSRHDDAWSCQTTVVVAAGRRRVWQLLASGLGAIGVTLLLPIAILLIGLAVALTLRGILEVMAWLSMLIAG